MNIFQSSYEARLQDWFQLRASVINLPIEQRCIIIDEWWQHAPLVNHYLHPHEIDTWPGPWELLNDNEYCPLARGLGMIYTLLLTGVTDVDFCIGKDDNDEDVALVMVDNAKYVLNYWPDMVVNINLTNFKITNSLDLNKIKTKL